MIKTIKIEDAIYTNTCQIAKVYGVSQRAVNGWIKSRKLRAVKVFNWGYLVKLDDLKKFEENKIIKL